VLFGDKSAKIQKLLVVEDEPLVAFDNEHFLGTHGYTVVGTIDNAVAARAMIAEGGIDLVLCDITLNGGDGSSGRDVAIAAKDAGIAVLFVTATCPSNASDIAVGCLAKPYSSKDLKLAIEAVAAQIEGKKPKRVPKGLRLY
jgi:DNA-binding NarL/FixJ family response regulator